MFTPSLMLLSKSSLTTPPGPDLNRRERRERRFSFPSPFPLFSPVEFLLRVFICLLLEELAGHGFAAARTAGLVHLRNHAGFKQGARRGESNFVRALVFHDVIPPLYRRQLLFHVTPCGGTDWKPPCRCRWLRVAGDA